MAPRHRVRLPGAAAEKPLSHTDDLLGALGITAEDLAANRVGRLGETQAANLRKSGLNNLLGALFAGVALAAILMFVAHKPLKPAQYITAGVLFAIVLAIGGNDFVKTRAAVQAGTVDVVAGPIAVRARGKNGWWLTVSGKSFRLPTQPWKLKNEAPYRVYFSTLANNRVVGMEPDGWG